MRASRVICKRTRKTSAPFPRRLCRTLLSSQGRSPSVPERSPVVRGPLMKTRTHRRYERYLSAEEIQLPSKPMQDVAKHRCEEGGGVRGVEVPDSSPPADSLRSSSLPCCIWRGTCLACSVSLKLRKTPAGVQIAPRFSSTRQIA